MKTCCHVRKHRAPNGALRRILTGEPSVRVSSGQRAPSAKRCIKTFFPRNFARLLECVRKHRAPNGALRLISQSDAVLADILVRKHRAPKGALRLISQSDAVLADILVRKHRAPKGALRPDDSTNTRMSPGFGQKAPSAKRCIKTALRGKRAPLRPTVRKHRAPNGALRHRSVCKYGLAIKRVRKHRAPNGALRLVTKYGDLQLYEHVRKHRAPNGALRLEFEVVPVDLVVVHVRKHRAPNGALRRLMSSAVSVCVEQSESTERQTVH